VPAADIDLDRSPRLGPVSGAAGGKHVFDTERITIEPFSLRDRPRYQLVIDRLAYWYYHPREWLKKVSMIDGVYLLNSPFTFQSMEKHAAYCAMMRLGLKVPETVLVPFKNPLDNSRYAYTAARYNQPFDLDVIAEQIGYPLFMKPYDGGAWRGVSQLPRQPVRLSQGPNGHQCSIFWPSTSRIHLAWPSQKAKLEPCWCRAQATRSTLPALYFPNV